MSQEIKRGHVRTLPDGRDVLVVSLTGLDGGHGSDHCQKHSSMTI
ncbi:hypothetical protein OKJ48_14530 [Streptomyces kunmingensis]|uniref:Uncharacterized protein n=1 Tax=Streptomyces kunmingensis TaxID=68225 RepID=A0ABU6C9S2_9ACTN|nr:hypothetical protein [Streptomyces kunmingensis]MEB3961454.1 hypothetical protein [Streptomyces kunmingensis]